ncbi:hypothetical protein IMSHALPRED_006141 [Imshaugia aleurites]|uniref:F-box domain-containing protein n=1 Tax=Imshaugia aleurites TaxID=172621 RepID=A0A8H3FNJ5_9LECA|nr:hypothetical protein IMSHALPRED_006141 [Imshaugia aleurites]
MDNWQRERRNSFHLWLCAQPTDFVSKVVPGQELTLAQNEERKQLAQMAYFGWRSDGNGFRTLNDNLPLLDRWQKETPRTGPPTVGLGTLDQLPIEILTYIISWLDISAIDQFKAMNRRSLEAVNAHPQFRIINQQAHDALRGLRAIKTAHMITVQTVFEKLCTRQCSECGDYGGYIYLVTFDRVCCRCFTRKDRYLPLREIDTIKEFGISLEKLRTLPRFLGYPGHYGKRLLLARKKEPYISLVDRASAYSAGIVCHGSFEAMQEYVANTNSNTRKHYKTEIVEREKELAVERAVKEREKKARWRAEVRKRNAHLIERMTRRQEREVRKRKGIALIEGVEDPGEDTDGGDISTPQATDYSSDDHPMFDHKVYRSDTEQTISEYIGESGDLRSWVCESFRYKAVIRVPWLNRKSGMGEWSLHCVGCEGLDLWPNHANREFIMSTFREHLKECGPIRAGVHHIDDCCKKGTCRKRKGYTSQAIYNMPF